MKTVRLTRIAAASCLALAGASSVFAQDWPQWRGPNRDGRVTGFKAPKAWPTELARQWKVSVGSGDASPVLAGNRLYVFARQGGDEVTLCLDPADGRQVWMDKNPVAAISGPDAALHPGPRSSPVVAEGKVITLGVSGVVTCLEAASGRVVWRREDFPGAWPRFHVAMSPIVIDGCGVVQLGKPGDGTTVAYDLATGKAKWKWTGDGPAYASPVVMMVAGIRVLVTLTEKSVVALGAADGKLLWQTPFETTGMAYNAATPIVDGQMVIYCGQGRGTKAVELKKADAGLVGKEVWANPGHAVQFNSPVLKDGRIYGLSARNDFFCLDAKSGTTLWAAPLSPPTAAAEEPVASEGKGKGRGGRVGGRTAGYGSILDAGGVLFALTPVGQLVAFAPGDTAYRELARIKVADTPVYAHPVLVGNRLFVKDQDSVSLLLIE